MHIICGCLKKYKDYNILLWLRNENGEGDSEMLAGSSFHLEDENSTNDYIGALTVCDEFIYICSDQEMLEASTRPRYLYTLTSGVLLRCKV